MSSCINVGIKPLKLLKENICVKKVVFFVKVMVTEMRFKVNSNDNWILFSSVILCYNNNSLIRVKLIMNCLIKSNKRNEKRCLNLSVTLLNGADLHRFVTPITFKIETTQSLKLQYYLIFLWKKKQ